jgi:hypothetical protein
MPYQARSVDSNTVWVVTEQPGGMEVWQEYGSYDGSGAGGNVWVVTVEPGGMEVWQEYGSYSG